MSFKVLVLCLLVKSSAAVIYSLNESEYHRMPPLYAMDDYSECMLDPGGTYCLVDFDLHTNSPSELMNIIQEYSAHTIKHYNHTQIHRAVCVSLTCKDYLRDTNNRSNDLNATLEGCVNETVWRKYKLEANLAQIHYCKRNDDVFELDVSDFVVAGVYCVIILLNIIGSYYDHVKSRGGNKSGNRYLLAFSIRRNWAKLTAPAGVGPDPRMERLKLFYGMRAMTMVCVIFSHTALTMAFSYIDNPLYIEKAYDDPLKQILFNGSLVTHTFFVMSSFLLAYNLQLHAEKHPISWTQIPKGILLRWIRLTPPYALIIATISTWMRHTGDGPLWHQVVTSESDLCRQYWWSNVFYFNNYIYNENQCLPQTWYLAADSQLFCAGLVLLVLVRSGRGRGVALALAFLASLAITAAHTYFQDLDAVVIQSPESYRNLYTKDETFLLVYIRGHTNLSTYTMGLAGGLLVYHWQEIGKDLSRHKILRWGFWLLFPAALAVLLSGGLFYMDGATPSTAFRVAYATLYKPVFQALVIAFIIGCIFKLESVYRGIVEWRALAVAGRASYSMFLLHTLFQRGLLGARATPTHLSDYYVLVVLCASLVLSLAGGALLWLAVEAPAAALARAPPPPPASPPAPREHRK